MVRDVVIAPCLDFYHPADTRNNREYQNDGGAFSRSDRDLYDAEKRLVKALPKIADAANSSRLRDAIQSHLRETESHVTRLESIFADLRKKPKAETCEGMKGLIDEGEGLTGDIDESPLRDAGIIAANRVEHYGIAAYGTARTFAQRLGRSKVASLLDETLNGGLQAYRSCAVYDQ